MLTIKAVYQIGWTMWINYLRFQGMLSFFVQVTVVEYFMFLGGLN